MQGIEADQADFRGADLRQVNMGGAYLQGALMPASVVGIDKDGFEKMLDAHAKVNGKGNGKEKAMER